MQCISLLYIPSGKEMCFHRARNPFSWTGYYIRSQSSESCVRRMSCGELHAAEFQCCLPHGVNNIFVHTEHERMHTRTLWMSSRIINVFALLGIFSVMYVLLRDANTCQICKLKRLRLGRPKLMRDRNTKHLRWASLMTSHIKRCSTWRPHIELKNMCVLMDDVDPKYSFGSALLRVHIHFL